MSRYYYRDPLAAAWMVDKFQMKFEAPYDGPIDFAVLGMMAKRKLIKIYIHSDSLHLLDPQRGDIWRTEGYSINVGESPGGIPTYARIIERNNIVFMWPESE